ncbi:TRADD-N-associated membrane domain-containing protein, partial [Vibrio genomosp. F10]
ITVSVGAISEVVSLLVFKFNKETNNRLDELRKDLSVIEVARVGLSIAKQIEDQDKRDHAISELSLRLQNG